MFENKFYHFRPDVCKEIGNITNVMLNAQGLSRNVMQLVSYSFLILCTIELTINNFFNRNWSLLYTNILFFQDSNEKLFKKSSNIFCRHPLWLVKRNPHLQKNIQFLINSEPKVKRQLTINVPILVSS